MTKIAVIKTGGKQYKVAQGDKIFIEKIEGKDGATIKFETLLVSDGNAKELELGTPALKTKVEGKILKQTKADKIDVIKFKAKSRYRRKLGHQQKKTQVEITRI